MRITFNRPYLTGREAQYIAQAHANLQLASGGEFSGRCNAWLKGHTGCAKSFITHSCTAALEMAAVLADIGPGDEVIMPSYTFASTANAFVLRGATPVFVDIRPDTLNLDERRIEQAITPRTRAIVPVHYAGVACEMDAIMDIAARNGLLVIEDAAHCTMVSYKGRALGSIGQLGCLSFHETKNIISGEGGALLVNDERFVERAEIVGEKGTNRSQFLRGHVDKYTWIDVGSSYLASELTAAFLWAQMEQAETITSRRLAIWERYHAAFAEPETQGLVRRPVLAGHGHNAHMYYLLPPSAAARDRIIEGLAQKDISAVFHYVPLHSSPAGRRFGRMHGDLTVTDDVAARLVRLPLWIGVEKVHETIISEILRLLRRERSQNRTQPEGAVE